MEDLLLEVDHVKYRKAGEGRSPIGRLMIFQEHVEWRDNASTDVISVKFIQIKGQRVSPPSKPKVQLQICLQNDDQATFVFLEPGKSLEELMQQRDTLKEVLQQALIEHRSRVNQLAASSEKGSTSTALEAKQRILLENKPLEQLYSHLVASKLITPQDFWGDYYKSTGLSEESAGISGAFLANIAQQEGTNGVKLNLNPEIIRAIFNTYPAVERKHLEVVPHEMSEQHFWSKFFQSHYYHREREVMPNPNDPFADCVRIDELEIDKLVKEGVHRKRFDLEHLDDNNLRDFLTKSENSKHTKTTLVRRCNYLSERIVSCLRPSTSAVNGVGDANGNGSSDTGPKGFAVLNRIVDEEESRLESSELSELADIRDTLVVRLGAAHAGVSKQFPPEEAAQYKKITLDFLDDTSVEDILMAEDDWYQDQSYMLTNGNATANGNGADHGANGVVDGMDWGLTPHDLAEVRCIHEAVSELLKHFWGCFPPLTPELETKLDRMETTLRTYEEGALLKAARRYGMENVKHCYEMISRAHQRYEVYNSKRKK